MTALIDADIICYVASAVAEQEIDWGDGADAMSSANKHQAREVAFKTVEEWTKGAWCSRPYLIFSF